MSMSDLLDRASDAAEADGIAVTDDPPFASAVIGSTRS